MKLILITMLVALTIAGAHGEPLSAQLAASQDNQTIKATGYEYIKDLSVTKNVTIVGSDINTTIDGSYLELMPTIGNKTHRTTVTLKGLIIKNCPRFYNTADLVIEDCRFIDTELDANSCAILAKNSSFAGTINGSIIGDGGAVLLTHTIGIFDHCTFINNSAYRNDTWHGGSGGGLRIVNSTIALIEPIIEHNLAAYGGGICVVNSDLSIYGGRIVFNEARVANVSQTLKLGGVGGAMDIILRSKVLLARVLIADNETPIGSALNVSEDSYVRAIDSKILP